MPPDYSLPFSNAPSADSFYFSIPHKECLDILSEAIENYKGLNLLIGKAGTGKTSLCNYIYEHNKDKWEIVFLRNPFLGEKKFLKELTAAFSIETGEREDIYYIEKFLLDAYHDKKIVLLIVDEVHLMPVELLSYIHLLSNLQYNGDHLLQIILIGQAEIKETLETPRFMSLNQRVGNCLELHKLDILETKGYIEFKLINSQFNNYYFTPASIKLIWKYSNGYPRLINYICAFCLDLHFKNKIYKISTSTINKAIDSYSLRKIFDINHKYDYKDYIIMSLLIFFMVFMASSLSDTNQEISYDFVEQDPKTVPPESEAIQKQVQSQLQAELEELESNIKNSVSNESIKDYKIKASVYEDPQLKVAQEMTEQEKFGYDNQIKFNDKINAIIWDTSPETRMAVIDNKFYKQGDMVGDFVILEIFKDHILFDYNGIQVYKSMKETEGE